MKLRTALIFAVDVMLFGLSAWSQEHPKWEVPIDYSYVHYQAIDFESRNGTISLGNITIWKAAAAESCTTSAT